MKTKYLLPCDCDDPVAVDASQAGLTVECNCGNKLQVPTMRGLAQCQRVEEQRATATTTWGVDQGVMVLGVVVFLVGLLGGLYAMSVARSYDSVEFTVSIDHDAHRKDIDAMTPSEVWIEWIRMPRSLERTARREDLPGLQRREAARAKLVTHYRRFSWIGFSVATAGAAIAITGFVVAFGRSRSRAGLARNAGA